MIHLQANGLFKISDSLAIILQVIRKSPVEPVVKQSHQDTKDKI